MDAPFRKVKNLSKQNNHMAMKHFIKVTSKLFLIGLVSIFISGAGLFSSKNKELATDKNIKNSKPFARIEGFSSAKFNMSMDQVKKIYL
jgi:hypothetical protein